MKRVSLADVARAAGVGKATASRALSGRDEVGAATRARITEIAATMGYQPHRGAQALRTGRFGILAISLSLGDADAGALVCGAAGEAAAHGYQLLVDASDVLGQAHERPGVMAVDGIVIVGPTAPALDIPAVTVDVAGPEPAQRAADAIRRLLAEVDEAFLHGA